MDLSKKIKNIPQEPGIYIFKDKNGKVLYVGKAKNLQKRLRQYLLSDSLKIKKLLDAASDLEIVETENEVIAIFKESDLIKKLNPPFNQLLRDDSRYFYLIFTEEILPRVLITHQPEKFKTKEIIGPFFEGTSLRKILMSLRKEIPFCTCREKHLRICLNAELGLCFGWCCLKKAEINNQKIKSYFQNLLWLKKIFTQDLKSLKKSLLTKIKKLLTKHSSLNLELAQRLKQAFLAIEKLETNQSLIQEENIFLEAETRKILLQLKEVFHLQALPHLIEAIDISHFANKEKVGILVSFLDGLYQPQLLRKFKIKTVLSPDDPRMIFEVLSRRLKHQEWGLPDLFLIDGGKSQYKMARKAIEENNFKIDVLALAKPKEEVYYDFDKKISLKDYPLLRNFILNLDQQAHQLVLKYHRKKRESTFMASSNA